MNVQHFTVVLLCERQSITQHEIPLNKEFVFQILNILSFLSVLRVDNDIVLKWITLLQQQLWDLPTCTV